MSEPIMSELLREADAVINGPRRVSYGPVEESFDASAKVLSVVLRKKLKEPLDAHDVGLMMLSHKLVRESNAHERDNLRDLAGYAALTERVSVKSPEREAAAREMLKDASEAQTEFEDEIKALLEDASAKKKEAWESEAMLNAMMPGSRGQNLGGEPASGDSGITPAKGGE